MPSEMNLHVFSVTQFLIFAQEEYYKLPDLGVKLGKKLATA
jgi:hypothetical protein